MLKRTAAILLIFIFLFNIVGYRWLFVHLENKATQKLEEKIDAGQYSDDQLVEIKIPLKVPYYTSTKYEPYYGETKFNGEHYRYVKRKVSNDTVYFLCIPHTEKNNIAAAKTDFIKSVNDIQNNSSQKQGQSSLVKLILSDYLPKEKISDDALILSVLKNITSFNYQLVSQFEPGTATQPPEMVS